MPLATTKEMLEAALEGHYAVGAFNANNMEMVQAIVEAATEERAPVILQVSQGAIRYAGLHFAAGLVKIAAENTDVPVALHLDHGTDFEQNVLCLREGFTSLMFDGSDLPLEENIRISKTVCGIAHICGIPVETELGKVLKRGATPEEVKAAMADPDEARRFIEETGADSLAVAIGSIHALLSQSAGLDIERLEETHQAIPEVPLVLHGSSGVEEDSVVESLDHGIAKVNVATYLSQAFTYAMFDHLKANPKAEDPRQHLAPAREAAKERVREKIRLFRSNGKIRPGGGFASPPTQHRVAEIGEAE
ncbi:MAG TPA: ketose-bisphosphate aldolase [Anaerolineae bacterium]|nr:ketose-bisphosphate aldolase [Anaerolineae bacterium]